MRGPAIGTPMKQLWGSVSAGAIFVGYGSLKIHGEKFSQIEPVGWVAVGLRICGQVSNFGLFLSALYCVNMHE